ncbi:HvfC/BufC N-terminal domain-containing protein [Massilia niastensis]|uniref:HvfC/BufC N-terminal domain-containing protein n=1 Tax=Massilia niastensis TaxID=544911 RepID=UPI0003663229|nr:DNA-binding domain-containing protein [Massilia niastensis]
MTLGDLQRDFRLWLASGAQDAAGRLAGATGAGLAVYQNNYRAQLVGCLEESYPQLRAHMGEEAFLHAAVRHIGKYPPHAWTLDAYADDFDATLAALFPANPDIHELAWIELALGAAFIAADALPVGPADFAGVDWDTVHLRLSPSLRMRAATTNAAAIWRALGSGATPPESAMLPEPGALIVWRSGYVSCLRAADLLELDALATLQVHGSFSALCEMLVGRLGEDEGIARAGALLADWIGAELITGITAD